MEHLWAPWRMDYILSNRKRNRCIFCPIPGQSDEKRLIIHRSPFSLVMFNRFPYAYAHMMVAPVRHVDQISKMKPEEMTDLLKNVARTVDILKKAFRPTGFNLGMNLGDVAGAGIRHHIHFHIIPRWKGDMNFMPALSDVRVIPEHLQQTYARLEPFFGNLED